MSGNLKGRPKGSKNLATVLTEAANGQVSATINGKTQKISKLHAGALQLATKAANGDLRALSQFFDRMKDIERQAAASRPAPYPLERADIEVIAEVYKRMKASKPSGEGGAK